MESIALSHLLLALLAGSLSTLNPCVFPLLPLVAGGSLQGHRAGPLVMGAGMVSSFALAGLLLGLAGPALGIDGDSLRLFGGSLLLLMGGLLLLPALGGRLAQGLSPLASRADGWSARFDSRTLPGAFMLGTLLGLVWSPCSGPLLISALTLVASEGGALRGTLILGAFGLGAAVPLIVAAHASRAAFGRARGWLQQHQPRMKLVFAGLLLLLGSAILLGWDKRLEALLVPLMPDWWVGLTVAI